jgi:trimethylamine:corrinoid methyltransferase-like protein
MKDLTPFDFMNAASFSKEDLIRDSDIPEHTEKMYTPYIVNRGFTNFEDTILHANEMNMRHGLFSGAQFDYYKSVLRKRKRFSKWPKADKDINLDAIQKVYECNRTVAKQYLKVLNKEQLETIHDKINEGG